MYIKPKNHRFMGVIESEGGTKHWPVGRFRDHDEYLTKTSRYTPFILQTFRDVAQKCKHPGI